MDSHPRGNGTTAPESHASHGTPNIEGTGDDEWASDPEQRLGEGNQPSLFFYIALSFAWS